MKRKYIFSIGFLFGLLWGVFTALMEIDTGDCMTGEGYCGLFFAIANFPSVFIIRLLRLWVFIPFSQGDIQNKVYEFMYIATIVSILNGVLLGMLFLFFARFFRFKKKHVKDVI